MAQDFKNLNVWQLAHELTIEIYKKSKSYPSEELYGLTLQIRRATMSIELNIAEGTCGSDTRFLKFLVIALGSAKETECCLMLSKDLMYLNKEDYEVLINKIKKVEGMLSNLIKTIKQKGD
jgi:four helix bundle protein